MRLRFSVFCCKENADTEPIDTLGVAPSLTGANGGL